MNPYVHPKFCSRLKGDHSKSNANCHIGQLLGWCDNLANDLRLPPKRNPKTQRIVELNPSLHFHHEQAQQINDQSEVLTPLKLRVAAPNYWTNVERQRTYRREPFVPTLNDVNAIIDGACNIPLEWLNRQVHFMKSHQQDMMKSNDEWYALNCIRGFTYFCGYVYYHYHVSTSNLIHSISR